MEIFAQLGLLGGGHDADVAQLVDTMLMLLTLILRHDADVAPLPSSRKNVSQGMYVVMILGFAQLGLLLTWWWTRHDADVAH